MKTEPINEEYMPRIIRGHDSHGNIYLDFRDSKNSNIALIRDGDETLENLETAYLGLQRAYEDDGTIERGKYLQWSQMLWERGLEIDEVDRQAIKELKNLVSKLRRSAA